MTQPLLLMYAEYVLTYAIGISTWIGSRFYKIKGSKLSPALYSFASVDLFKGQHSNDAIK
jgi:hypothetical protein